MAYYTSRNEVPKFRPLSGFLRKRRVQGITLRLEEFAEFVENGLCGVDTGFKFFGIFWNVAEVSTWGEAFFLATAVFANIISVGIFFNFDKNFFFAETAFSAH